ncbi:MAG: Agmatinase, partial [Candidatus Magnetoglobus multicellularis str. Araruama]
MIFNNFLGLTATDADPKMAKAYILPIPYERTTSYLKGTANAPKAILEASKELETFDIATPCQDPYLASNGIYTCPPLKISQPSFVEFCDYLQHYLTEILAQQKFPILLGGEHTLSYGAFLSCRTLYPDCSFLHLDAHTDLRDIYEGTAYSHACVLRRICELKPRPPIVACGVRSLPREDYVYIIEEDLKVFFYEKTGLPTLGQILENLSYNVYISIDLDCLDPAIMPAVGTPEPHGLSW